MSIPLFFSSEWQTAPHDSDSNDSVELQPQPVGAGNGGPSNGGPSNALPTNTHVNNHPFVAKMAHGLSTGPPQPLPYQPLEPPFSKDMRDLQARGKDPYEYTRQGMPFYQARLDSVHSAKTVQYHSRPSGQSYAQLILQQQSQQQQVQQNIHGLQQQLQQLQQAIQGQAQPSTGAQIHEMHQLMAAISDLGQLQQRQQQQHQQLRHEHQRQEQQLQNQLQQQQLQRQQRYTHTQPLGPRHMPGEAPLDHFSILERRRQAALVLSNPEMLMMYAQSMNDSIPSVRMRFTRILCGLDRETLESPAAIADWAEEEAWEEAEREAELMFPSSAFDRFSCRTLDSYGSSTSSPSMGPSKRRQSNNVERPTRRPWRGQPPKLL